MHGLHFGLSPFSNAIAFVTKDTIVLPTNVQVQTTAITLNAGDVFGINAKVIPDNATDKGITYTSSNSDVAEVNYKGFITANSTGTANITVATNNEDGKTATIVVTVK